MNKIHNFELENYTSVLQTRGNQARGGVRILIHKSINSYLYNDLNVNETDCESNWVEALDKPTKKVIVDTIFRQPDGYLKKKTHLSKTLQKKWIKHKSVFTSVT